jgi:O-antigen/teichoic acid export membrane protein
MPTEQSTRELDRRLAAGIAWTAVWRWTAQAISWMATFYVARVLDPSDYGLVAMAMVPIGLARLIEDFGLDSIIVQDRSLGEAQLNQLAGAALALGSILALSFAALAHAVSLYFHEPQVTPVILILCLTFITDSIQILPRALLQRDLQFKTLAWIQCLQVSTAAIIMVLLARGGLGFWALVFNTVLSQLAITVLLCYLRPFRPQYPRELRHIAHPLVAGWQMIVSRIGYYAYTNIDSALIGRLFGKDALGAYGFATTFAALPVKEVTSLTSTVVPGVFSSIQSNPSALRRYFLLLTEAVMIITLPAALGLATTADDFILLALGEKWRAVIVPLQILCLYYAMSSPPALLNHVIIWTGHFRANMWLTMYSLLVLSSAIYVGTAYGVIGVCWGWTLGYPISSIPMIYLASRILSLSWPDALKSMQASFVSCAGMLVMVGLARWNLPSDLHHGLRLGIQAAIGSLTYAVILYGLFRNRLKLLHQASRGEVEH